MALRAVHLLTSWSTAIMEMVRGGGGGEWEEMVKDGGGWEEMVKNGGEWEEIVRGGGECEEIVRGGERVGDGVQWEREWEMVRSGRKNRRW